MKISQKIALMLTKHDEYDTVKAYSKYLDLLTTYNKLMNIENKKSIKYRLQYFIFNCIKIPLYDLYLDNLIDDWYLSIQKSPMYIFFNSVRFVILLSLYQDKNHNVKEVFDTIYGNEDTIYLSFFYDFFAKSATCTKFHMIYRSKIENKENKYNNKFRILTMKSDLENYDFSIEELIYDCDNYETSKTSNIINRKYFELDRDGYIKNTDYNFNQRLLPKDESYFIYLASIFITIFCKFTCYILSPDKFKEVK